MRTIALALAAAAGLVTAQVAVAGDDCGGAPSCCGEVCGAPNCCNHCGCCSPCKKVCRVVCEMKEVKVTCWDVECEDFCAPMPRLGCDGCSKGCGSSCCTPDVGCCESGCCSNGCCKEKCITPPKCGKVRCKKKLVKREVTKMVPVYKCVVEYVCCNCCGNGCGDGCGGCSVAGCGVAEIADPAEASPVPAAPVPEAPRPKGT